MTRGRWRAPFVAIALLSMAYGVWLGLLRIGWALPLRWPDQLILHGPLMVGGFLGTLIGLERAVGIAKPWAYAAPACTALGSALLVFGPPSPVGVVLVALGSAVVGAVFVVVLWRETSLFAATMAMGVAAWIVGNLLWVGGSGIYRLAPWWLGFVVLTIAGERLELTRMRRPSNLIRGWFVVVASIAVGGVAISWTRPEMGIRVAGAGFLALAVWLGLHDVARRTVRQHGVTRFIAVCLLSGYAWLGVAGATALASAPTSPGTLYDAMLHAVFLGFVMAMIFGHAPIVFPAILGRPMRFSTAFYAHLAVLHISVAIRLLGDFVDELGRLRAWGGLLNAVAIALFVANTVAAIALGRR